MRPSVLAGLFVAASACGGGSAGSDTPQGEFCAAAAGAPDCDTVERCEEHFTQGRVMNPKCSGLYDQFATCLSKLQLACVNGPDFEVHATGDGSPYDFFIEVVPVYLFYVKDTACRKIGEDLQTCTVCADAVGYPGGRGVGDRCSTANACAAGLSCTFGMCTKSCTDGNQCLGTKVDPFSCHNEFGQANLCIAGMCTSESHVSNNFCADYGAGWQPAGAGLYCAHP